MPDTALEPNSQLHIYRRNRVWYCRLPVKKQGRRRYIWRSMKTASLAEARIKAQEWRLEVMFAERYRLSLFPKTVDQVINQWLEETDLTTAIRSACVKSLTYWREFIGRKLITNLDDLSSYVKWRRDYWKLHNRDGKPTTKPDPSDRTIALELQTIRRVFAFAVGKGFVPKAPDVPGLRRVVRNRRPALTLEEQFKLKNTLLR